MITACSGPGTRARRPRRAGRREGPRSDTRVPASPGPPLGGVVPVRVPEHRSRTGLRRGHRRGCGAGPGDDAHGAVPPDRPPGRPPRDRCARGALRVSVVQRLENPTDRTIVSSPRDPLVFPLSPGAQSVRFLSGWVDPRVDSGTITDAFPVTPGRTEVAYAYILDARQSEVAVP